MSSLTWSGSKQIKQRITRRLLYLKTSFTHHQQIKCILTSSSALLFPVRKSNEECILWQQFQRFYSPFKTCRKWNGFYKLRIHTMLTKDSDCIKLLYIKPALTRCKKLIHSITKQFCVKCNWEYHNNPFHSYFILIWLVQENDNMTYFQY